MKKIKKIYCFVVFGIFMAVCPFGEVNAAEWDTNFSDAASLQDISESGVQVNLDYGELLNGYGPSNVVNIQSGGSSSILTSADRKVAIKYVAAASKDITKVMLLPCCYFPTTGQPVWKVSIQTDNNGIPSGNELGFGTFGESGTIADEEWVTISLPSLHITKGQTYWIVVQYYSGPTPTATEHYIKFYSSGPSLPAEYSPSYDNVPLAYNYGGLNKNINDTSVTTIKWYNDQVSAWQGEPNRRTLATFLLGFSDNTYHGQAYKHNYASIGLSVSEDKIYAIGEIFVNHNQDRIVDRLDTPLNVFHTDGTYLLPADNLYYYLKKGDWNGELIASGTFITPAQVYENPQGIGNGAGDRRWYSKTLDAPVTLLKDQRYFLYFSSPGSDMTAHWGTDAGNAESDNVSATGIALGENSFDRDDSYSVRTQTPRTQNLWSDIRIDSGRDLSFRFHLADVLTGEFSSVFKSAEASGSAGDKWKKIKYKGTVPAGTGIDLSVDSVSCGGYIIVKENAISGEEYDLPSCALTKEVRWKVALKTNDTAITPKIYSVSLINGVIETISAPVFSPAQGTYTASQTVAITSATAGASIYYTMDGSTPTISSSVYSSPLTISSSKTIKAVAVKSGSVSSDISTAAYIINTSTGGTGGSGGGTSSLIPIIIKTEVISVTDNQVSLALNVTNATQMMLSDNSNFTGSTWETYATTKTYTKTDTQTKLYLKFKSSTDTVSSTVELNIPADITPPNSGNTPDNNTGNNTPSPYPTGTLLKLSDSFKVYVIIDNKKKWIPTPEVFEQLGYKWTEIKILTQTELNNIPDYEDNLIRAINDYKVYLVVSGVKRHIPNPIIFLDYGFKWEEVKDVPQSTIDKYKNTYLIKQSGSNGIYYVNPQEIRKLIPSTEVFNSYNDKTEDIQIISKTEMDFYPLSNLIKLNGSNDIYLIEGSTKKRIPNPQVFNKYKLNWNLVMSVNQTEFNFYSDGGELK